MKNAGEPWGNSGSDMLAFGSSGVALVGNVVGPVTLYEWEMDGLVSPWDWL